MSPFPPHLGSQAVTSSVKADVSLSLVCGVAASSGGVTWAHVLALAKLLTIQPIESNGAFPLTGVSMEASRTGTPAVDRIT